MVYFHHQPLSPSPFSRSRHLFSPSHPPSTCPQPIITIMQFSIASLFAAAVLFAGQAAAIASDPCEYNIRLRGELAARRL